MPHKEIRLDPELEKRDCYVQLRCTWTFSHRCPVTLNIIPWGTWWSSHLHTRLGEVKLVIQVTQQGEWGGWNLSNSESVSPSHVFLEKGQREPDTRNLHCLKLPCPGMATGKVAVCGDFLDNLLRSVEKTGGRKGFLFGALGIWDRYLMMLIKYLLKPCALPSFLSHHNMDLSLETVYDILPCPPSPDQVLKDTRVTEIKPF